MKTAILLIAHNGRESTAKSVPHMNVIGRMTTLEIMFSVGVECASSPAMIPRSSSPMPRGC